jgi:hypothetical protein
MQMDTTYGEADWAATDDIIGPIAMNWRGGVAAVQISVTGTIDYDVEMTLSDIQNSADAPVWFIDNATTQDGATGSIVFAVDNNPRAMRIIVNSSTTATVRVQIVQSDV